MYTYWNPTQKIWLDPVAVSQCAGPENPGIACLLAGNKSNQPDKQAENTDVT